MHEETRKDILSLIGEAIAALKKRNFAELKIISNHIIHNASIFQDEDSVSIAVIMYALFKVTARFEDDAKAVERFCAILESARERLKYKDMEGYRNEIKQLFKIISNVDDKLKQYIEEVINHAEIRKGFKLYEHGISIARAAEILGITQWELMSYAGKTQIEDIEKEPVDIGKRVAFAKRLFGI